MSYKYVTENGKRKRWYIPKCERCKREISYNSRYITSGSESWHDRCFAKKELEDQGVYDYTNEFIEEWIKDPEEGVK